MDPPNLFVELKRHSCRIRNPLLFLAELGEILDAAVKRVDGTNLLRT
jgi:hypothetical protein